MKGGQQLICDGYPFTRHRVRGSTIYWRCVQSRPLGCKSRIIQSSTGYNTEQVLHNHFVVKERRKKGVLKVLKGERKH